MIVNAAVISRDPLIITVGNNPDDRFLGHARIIAEHYGLKKFYIFVTPQFSIWQKPETDKVERVEAIKQFLIDYPQAEVVYLCNEGIEMEVFRDTGLQAVHINQNAFIDENLFYPVETSKKYDAIYVGQLQEFKRHELSKLIKKIAFVYYGRNFDYLDKIRTDVPQADFLNGMPIELGGDGNRSLKSWEMSVAYNQSRVGLCLSKVEGAMYAAVEYLLCGIPVVTTHNFGGRNDFLDTHNSITVNADKDDVFEAVQHFVQNPSSPEKIRHGALEKMTFHREKFFDLVDNIFHTNGQEARKLSVEFPRISKDKLWKSRCPLETLLL